MSSLVKVGGGIFHNLGWKMISLGAAVVIWALVATEPEMAMFTTVRLEYNHLPEDLDISSEPVQSVVLELKGPSGELREGLRPAVIVDVGGVGPGMHTFTIGDRNVRLSRGVRLLSVSPSVVRVQFEQHTQRTVPVRVAWTGPAPEKYEVRPASVGIEGPSSHVARIEAAVTDPVDLSRMSGSAIRLNLMMAPEDPYVRFRSTAMATVEIGK
jgi:hypothetical protein